MNFNKIQVIDFSSGIHSDEVLENDILLQEQIERERLAIAGSGINYGLELEIKNGFTLSISEGTLIDNDGTEIYIEGKEIEIDKPDIIIKNEKVKSKENGKIYLEEIPYSDNRTCISEHETDINARGITAYYEDNASTELAISDIDGTCLFTNATNSDRSIIVSYNISNNRIDTVYLDNNYDIMIAKSLNSTTPSAYIPDDCKYVLGYVKVESKFYDEITGDRIAKAFVIENFNNRRTVYTDSHNNLYLCGIPFSSFSKIYLEEPKNPENGTVWYDMTTNKLKIWRRTDNFVFSDILSFNSINPNAPKLFKTSVGYRAYQLTVYTNDISYDGKSLWRKLDNKELEYYTDLKEDEKATKDSKEFRVLANIKTGAKIKYSINRYDGSYEWVAVNDSSYINARESKIWGPNADCDNFVNYIPGISINEMKLDRKQHDMKTFMFKADEINLRFTPYKKELSIIIDQIPLFTDQFIEITAEDVLNNEELFKMATSEYGYTSELLHELNENYQPIGLGFKLAEPLDRPGYVEVLIENRVNDSSSKKKFQRCATFSKKESITYSKSKCNIVNGAVIINTKAPYFYGEEQLDVYVDGRLVDKQAVTEISTTENIIGAMCKSFAVDIAKASIDEGSTIFYKTAANIYSYDHVSSIIEELCKDKMDEMQYVITAKFKEIAITETVDIEGEDIAKYVSSRMPSKTSQLKNDSGFITADQVKVTEEMLSDYAKKSSIPTKMSQLTNDAGYALSNDVARSLETLNKKIQELEKSISALQHVKASYDESTGNLTV